MPSFIGLLKEFRILLPMTVEEYQIGQLYSVAEASKEVTGGGDGVEVVVNEPYKRKVTNSNGEEVEECGQLTNKIYHLEKKVPGFIRTIAPTGSLTVEEQAHNAYPYCCTIITNKGYMKEGFELSIKTWHKQDDGSLHNVHNLNDEELNAREVVYIDIVNDAIKSQDYKESEDPSKFHSEKTGRGPLQPNWKETQKPLMCCYKLVYMKFKWWGLQGRIEKFVMNQEKRLFTLFHRQVFCWLDKYHGMTMADIRALEDKTKDDLQKERTTGELRGFSADKEK
ncbi:phosphatidylinositol transfer protein alpha isoform [Strongylocentrotus purpuratus]|uniref:Phosphatidylinositol transfer protein N-terminal domain-containing protein n=1 Tax=Strongylocentrotus purpuratus TaxID=7668 RepID=A0A7M7P8J3_STRPU|nr:phosphatidylinositol transfer protein alpha isoform [Strongylocentrotus purpuratus]